MIGLIGAYHEIGRGIVKPVFINMMNLGPFGKFASKSICSNDNMLKSEFPISVDVLSPCNRMNTSGTIRRSGEFKLAASLVTLIMGVAKISGFNWVRASIHGAISTSFDIWHEYLLGVRLGVYLLHIIA